MLMHEYGPKTHRVTYIQAGLRGRHACISEAPKSTKELFTNRGCYLRTCVGNLHLLRCGPLPTTQQFDNSTSSFALSPASCPLPSFSRLSICYEGTALRPSIPPVLTLSIVWKDHPVSASPGMGRILPQLQSPFPQSSHLFHYKPQS